MFSSVMSVYSVCDVVGLFFSSFVVVVVVVVVGVGFYLAKKICL